MGLELDGIDAGLGRRIDVCVSRTEASVVGLRDFGDDEARVAFSNTPICQLERGVHAA